MDLHEGEISGANSICISQLPKNFFFSSMDAAQLLSGAKKCALIRSPQYDAQEGWVSAAAQSGCAIVFGVCDAARLAGFKKAILVSKMRMLVAMCKKYGAKICVCSLAQKEYEARNEHERLCFAMYLGLERKEAKEAVGLLGKKLKVVQ